MVTIVPFVYEQFSCIGDLCPDTCCAGWNIYVDDDSVSYYTSVDGPLGDELREKIVTTEAPARFALTDDLRCPFLNDNNLCRIYIGLGHDKLCGTCQRFPRLEYMKGDLTFIYTSIACPESARLYLAQKEPLNIYVRNVPSAHKAPQTDETSRILDTFSTGINLMQDRHMALKERITLTLLYYHNQSSLYAEGKNTFVNRYLFSDPARYSQVLAGQKPCSHDLMQRLKLLHLASEILKPSPDDPLTALFESFTSFYSETNTATFISLLEKSFSDYESVCEDSEKENLLVYLLMRYTIDPVQKDDIYSATVISVAYYVIYVCLVALASLSKKKMLPFAERLLILCRLSRHLEHNKKNTQSLLQKMKDSDMTAPQALLMLL